MGMGALPLEVLQGFVSCLHEALKHNTISSFYIVLLISKSQSALQWKSIPLSPCTDVKQEQEGK